MKKIKTILSALLVFVMLTAVTGCGKKEENSLVGVWEYSENGMTFTYDLKADGTGTYTMNTTGEDVVYELKYETKDSHLLVTYVNNDVFSEEDVFDNEYSFKDANTLIIKDSFGTEMEFVKK